MIPLLLNELKLILEINESLFMKTDIQYYFHLITLETRIKDPKGKKITKLTSFSFALIKCNTERHISPFPFTFF